MRLEEFQSLTTKIAQNLSNQALVTELLTQLNDDYAQESTTKENLTKQIGEYDGQIEQLQKTNMNLFLKVAQPVPDKVLTTTEPLKYDDLISDLEGSK